MNETQRIQELSYSISELERPVTTIINTYYSDNVLYNKLQSTSSKYVITIESGDIIGDIIEKDIPAAILLLAASNAGCHFSIETSENLANTKLYLYPDGLTNQNEAEELLKSIYSFNSIYSNNNLLFLRSGNIQSRIFLFGTKLDFPSPTFTSRKLMDYNTRYGFNMLYSDSDGTFEMNTIVG